MIDPATLDESKIIQHCMRLQANVDGGEYHENACRELADLLVCIRWFERTLHDSESATLNATARCAEAERRLSEIDSAVTKMTEKIESAIRVAVELDRYKIIASLIVIWMKCGSQVPVDGLSLAIDTILSMQEPDVNLDPVEGV